MKTFNMLLDDLSKLYGLPPYNTDTNFVRGDGYFASAIEQSYSQEDIQKAKKQLGVK